jgi:hypothetical protein
MYIFVLLGQTLKGSVKELVHTGVFLPSHRPKTPKEIDIEDPWPQAAENVLAVAVHACVHAALFWVLSRSMCPKRSKTRLKR